MISINPQTYVITIPQADLTLDSGTLYRFDTNQFRKDLKDWEDSIEGMSHTKTHDHVTEITIAGTTYARFIVILAPYSVEFEDGIYSVILEGSNSNIWDVGAGVLVQNQVQVIPTNSAGNTVTAVGSGVFPADIAAITSGVWEELLTSHVTASTFGFIVQQIKAKIDEDVAWSRKASDNAEQVNNKIN